VLLQTNPAAPKYVLNAYDNLGRATAVAEYTGDGSGDVTAGDNPLTRTTDRLRLTQTFYDEMGRAWKSQRHQIDDADGSDDDNLQTLIWHDAAGRVVKVDGTQLAKTLYDRLGRTTHRSVLAKDNDTGYGDADDVSGDVVLQESQTVYESTDSDDVLMSAVIDRFHDDRSGTDPPGHTLGALDTNADADVLKYTATNVKRSDHVNWYDHFGASLTPCDADLRRADFVRRASVPSRRTQRRHGYVFYTDGSSEPSIRGAATPMMPRGGRWHNQNVLMTRRSSSAERPQWRRRPLHAVRLHRWPPDQDVGGPGRRQRRGIR
jgi:hypothetical protein